VSLNIKSSYKTAQ